MEKLRTALVGTGKIGRIHAAALRDLPESEFVAVCGRPSDRLQAFAGQYRVQAFTDVGEMLGAARAGVHVLVEKPMASTLADCDAMIAAAQAGGSTLGVVSQRRFFPPCQRIRRALDGGLLGRPVLGTATILGWRDQAYYRSDPWRGSWAGEGGGVLVNQSPHQLDLLLWYMGEVAEVFGYWANLNHPYIEVDDAAVAVVRFRSGALGNIVVSNSQNPGINARVSVHGENGASVGVQTDGGSMFIAGSTGMADAAFNDIWTIPGEEGHPAVWRRQDEALLRAADPMEHFHRLQVADFLQAALAGRQPSVTAADGRRTVELFTAIYRAARDGLPARFPLPAE